MPRIARKNLESCFCHVIVQGINKEFIFRNNTFIEEYLKLILEKAKENSVNIIAYCIMNNHAHLLTYSENTQNLSKCMQKINTAYSIFYNKANKRVGYVFRDRFYSQQILSEKQLYACVKYIHNNPVKADICISMKDYKYSSYNEYLGRQNIIDDESIKLLFGSKDNYIENFLEIHKNIDENDEVFFDLKNENILTFIRRTEKKYNRKIEELKLNKILLKKVIIEAKKETNVTIIELANLLNVSRNIIEQICKEDCKR